jgi:hypothetical protein
MSGRMNKNKAILFLDSFNVNRFLCDVVAVSIYCSGEDTKISPVETVHMVKEGVSRGCAYYIKTCTVINQSTYTYISTQLSETAIFDSHAGHKSMLWSPDATEEEKLPGEV